MKDQIIKDGRRHDVDMSLAIGAKLDEERLRIQRKQNIIKTVFIFGMMGIAIILIKVVA